MAPSFKKCGLPVALDGSKDHEKNSEGIQNYEMSKPFDEDEMSKPFDEDEMSKPFDEENLRLIENDKNNKSDGEENNI